MMCCCPFKHLLVHVSVFLASWITFSCRCVSAFCFTLRQTSPYDVYAYGVFQTIGPRHCDFPHSRNIFSLSATRTTSPLIDSGAELLNEKRIKEIIERFDLTPNKHDMFWLNRYVELEHYKEVNGDCLVPQKYPENQQLGRWTNNQRTHYRYLMQKDNPHREKTKRESNMKEWRIKLFEEIGFEWEVTGWEDVWEQRFEDLMKYKDEHGDCDVPTEYKKNRKLGIWVNTQRKQYRLLQEGKESDMTDERIKKLERIGFQWYVKGPNVPWEDRFEELKEFKKRFKNCNVPQLWKGSRELSYWVNTQRKQYRLLQEGKESSMTKERIELLESIDFQWTVQVPWEERFEQLNEFKNRFKHCNVPMNWKENRELSLWVMNQRAQYRLMKEGIESEISDERVELLESIGFEWTVQVPWEKRFEELKEFKRRFNHCNVPQNWEENRKLGNWVSKQRTQYGLMQDGKPSQMTDERIHLLESVGFQWSLRPKRK